MVDAGWDQGLDSDPAPQPAGLWSVWNGQCPAASPASYSALLSEHPEGCQALAVRITATWHWLVRTLAGIGHCWPPL